MGRAHSVAVLRTEVILTVLCACSFMLSSCLFVKAPEQKTEVVNAPLSPLPELEMSDELVRTPSGDMLAMLPKGWLFLDARSEQSSEVIAIAVNPEYTMTAVFQGLHGEATKEEIDKEGLLGLARAAYNKHVRKTAGAAKLVGTYSVAELGPRRFGLYDFASSAGALRTRCAVFTSSTGNAYEFALVPLNVTGRDMPADAELVQVFRSIVATIQY